MINTEILAGDVLIVDRRIPVSHKIVIAALEGQ